MILEINHNSFKVIGSKPIELNINFNYTNNEPLFETIKIEDGKIYNLEFHQARVDRSYKEYYKIDSTINLKEYLKTPPLNGIYRAKLIYNKFGFVSLNYYKYSKKIIKKLALVEIKDFEYSYKYLNRDSFNQLAKIADEVIITKNGYLKDATIANIALLDKKSKIWHTPQEPLLQGTSLQKHLEEKNITKENIHYKDLKNYSKIALLNAMIDFYIISREKNG